MASVAGRKFPINPASELITLFRSFDLPLLCLMSLLSLLRNKLSWLPRFEALCLNYTFTPKLHLVFKMALTSSATPYFAFLSLVVACIPGLCWLVKKIIRYRKRRTNSYSERRNRDILPTNLQQLSPALSTEDRRTHFANQPIFTINNGQRQLSSTSRRTPDCFILVSDDEGYAVSLNGTFLTSYIQGPASLRSEQTLYHSYTWSMSPHERRSNEAMQTRYSR